MQCKWGSMELYHSTLIGEALQHLHGNHELLLNSALSVYISREKPAGMILLPRWRTGEPQFCRWNLHLFFGVYPHAITDCSWWWQNCSPTAIHFATVMSRMLGARESHFARVYTMQRQLPRHCLLQQHNGATMHHKREIGSKVIQLHWNTLPLIIQWVTSVCAYNNLQMCATCIHACLIFLSVLVKPLVMFDSIHEIVQKSEHNCGPKEAC